MMPDYLYLSKHNCGQIISQDECRKILLEMLNALSEFCDDNGLRYYLSGGTLLGAIRHKGFIPWDDDIDINMPRPDCERLISLTGGQLGNYSVFEPDISGFSPCCGFYRLYNFDVVIENSLGGSATNNPIYHPLFIDIFPIEGLPTSVKETSRHYKRIVSLRTMQRSASLKHMEAKSFAGHLFHIVSFIPAKAYGYKRWSQAIQRCAKKYDFNDSEFIGVMTAPVHTTNEKVLKSEYIVPVDIEFEGKKYHAPKNYHTYLTQLYGDYMQLPPIEKQKSHHAFSTYWNTESNGGKKK